MYINYTCALVESARGLDIIKRQYIATSQEKLQGSVDCLDSIDLLVPGERLKKKKKKGLVTVNYLSNQTTLRILRILVMLIDND